MIFCAIGNDFRLTTEIRPVTQRNHIIAERDSAYGKHLTSSAVLFSFLPKPSFLISRNRDVIFKLFRN